MPNLKNRYMNALTYLFTANEDYLPVKDASGKEILSIERRVLQLRQNNSIAIVGIIDADGLSEYEIERHCRYNQEWLLKISPSISAKAVDIFVFSNYDEGSLDDVIHTYSGRYHDILIGDISKKIVFCNDEEDCDRLHLSVSRKAFEIMDESFDDLSKTYETIDVFNEELSYVMTHNKIPATVTIMIITALIYGLDILIKQLTGDEVIKIAGVKESYLITIGQYWRIITPMFLHADIMHLATNMFSLYIIGQTVEKYFGSINFVFIYFLGGVMGNVFSYTLTQNVSLGASGAIFGIGGAVVLLWKMKGSRLLRMSGRDLFLVILIVLNIISGFGNSGIDNWAHLGGLVGGFMISLGLGYHKDTIKKETKIMSIALFVILAVVMYYFGYIKWVELYSI